MGRRPVAAKESKTIQNYQFRKTTPFFNTQLKKELISLRCLNPILTNTNTTIMTKTRPFSVAILESKDPKKEAAMNTNKHNPGGHGRKIVNKLMNAEKNGTFKEARNGGQK